MGDRRWPLHASPLATRFLGLQTVWVWIQHLHKRGSHRSRLHQKHPSRVFSHHVMCDKCTVSEMKLSENLRAHIRMRMLLKLTLRRCAVLMLNYWQLVCDHIVCQEKTCVQSTHDNSQSSPLNYCWIQNKMPLVIFVISGDF